ncbi:hypothetical protein ZWY2020_030044 [Hordeum vulgare]|nr:hypothetical protein ZWY2020_030044 [Hordeum vulgare]
MRRIFRWHATKRVARTAQQGGDSLLSATAASALADAIQFYDIQDRHADQPSKAIEWLIQAATAIDGLPSLDCSSPPAASPAAEDTAEVSTSRPAGPCSPPTAPADSDNAATKPMHTAGHCQWHACRALHCSNAADKPMQHQHHQQQPTLAYAAPVRTPRPCPF